jgi:plasmid stabilization system protein ParE
VTVTYTVDAAQDLDEYIQRIEQDDKPVLAIQVRQRIEALLDILAEYPAMGRLRHVRTLHRDARVFPLKPFPLLAIYEQSQDGIVVLRLYQGAREPIV